MVKTESNSNDNNNSKKRPSPSSTAKTMTNENEHPNHHLGRNKSAKTKQPKTAPSTPWYDTTSSSSKKQKSTKATTTMTMADKFKPMRCSDDIGPLPSLTRLAQRENLAGITNDNDQNLQLLLWECDCHYVLLDHQFRGIRAMAGVPDDFPGPLKLKLKQSKQKKPMDLTKIDDEGSAEKEAYDQAVFDWVYKVLRKATPRRENDRGVLMADVMGLGKVRFFVFLFLRLVLEWD